MKPVTGTAPVFPERLVSGADKAASVLRAALDEPLAGPSESRGFQLLVARRERRAPAWRVLATTAALGAFVLGWVLLTPAVPRVSVQREMLRPKAAPSAPAVALDIARPVVVTRNAESTPVRSKSPRRAAATADATQCAGLARAEQYAAAVACYDRIASGTSMASELALYEKARLESKALGRPDAALLTLDAHERRFPAGVLSAEVQLSRIELLIQKGSSASALAAIERGMREGLGRERGGDLQALSADLLATRGDCDAARLALSQARSSGVHPSRLAAAARRCEATEAAAASPAAAPSAL